MKSELLIKILEVLDETGPNQIPIKKLIKESGKSNQKDFSQAIMYLYSKKRVQFFEDNIRINEPNFETAKVSITSEGVDFLEREKRDISIVKIQEQQLDIQRQQKKIIEKQTFFTEFLALGTIVLALGTFLSFFKDMFFDLSRISNSFLGKFISAFVILAVVLMFIIIGTILVKFFSYFNKK